MPSPPESPAGAPPAAPVRLHAGLAHAAALAALCCVVLTLTSLYVGSETCCYFWDYAFYQNLAIRATVAFRESLGSGLAVVVQSTREDYNALFVLPLVPLIRAFGETRLGYELALAFAYLLPFALAVGGAAVKLIRGPAAAVFWSTAALALLTPMAWVPGLRGYPDVGAALFVVLALRSCLGDMGLRRPRTVLLVGVLLAAAVVYRRHFLLTAPALLATVALSALVGEAPTLRREPRKAAARLLWTALRILLTASAGLLAAFVVARPVAQRLLAHDFYSLYSAYRMPARTVALWYVEPYGWLACVGAITGLVVGAATGALEGRRALFVGVFGALGFLQWVLVVRQVGEQYTLHFTPTLVLGLSALGWTLWTKGTGAVRELVPAAAQVYVVANLFFGLGAFDLVNVRVAFRSLLAANWPPLTREDHYDIGLMVDALRKRAQPRDPIFVVASSTTMNPDLLANAERTLYGWNHARLDVLDTPSVDSRDQYPLEALLQAQFVVVVRPLQLHLAADQQKVLAVVYDMFGENVAMARDFAALPEHLRLLGDATVTLYRRSRPSSLETGLDTLGCIQSRFSSPPGSQPDWAIVSERYPSWVARRADGATTLTWHPAGPGDLPAPVALYLGTFPDRIRVAGTFRFVDGRCRGAAAAFSFLAPDGSIAEATEVVRHPGQSGDFEAVFAGRPGSRLLLRLGIPRGQASIDHCLLQIDSLVVRQAGN